MKPKQQGMTQAYSTMGRVVHHCGSIEARHLQAIKQKGQNLHQRMEHQIATLLFPLKPRGFVNFFVIP
jgi:uncharacterized membrane protein YgcG